MFDFDFDQVCWEFAIEMNGFRWAYQHQKDRRLEAMRRVQNEMILRLLFGQPLL